MLIHVIEAPAVQTEVKLTSTNWLHNRLVTCNKQWPTQSVLGPERADLSDGKLAKGCNQLQFNLIRTTTNLIPTCSGWGCHLKQWNEPGIMTDGRQNSKLNNYTEQMFRIREQSWLRNPFISPIVYNLWFGGRLKTMRASEACQTHERLPIICFRFYVMLMEKTVVTAFVMTHIWSYSSW